MMQIDISESIKFQKEMDGAIFDFMIWWCKFYEYRQTESSIEKSINNDIANYNSKTEKEWKEYFGEYK